MEIGRPAVDHTGRDLSPACPGVRGAGAAIDRREASGWSDRLDIRVRSILLRARNCRCREQALVRHTQQIVTGESGVGFCRVVSEVEAHNGGY
jgi:hypothetical protein